METQSASFEEDHCVKKKKTTVALTSALFVLGGIVSTVALVCYSSPSDSMKSIKLICQPTPYRERCQDALSQSATANSTSDPKKLLQAAFQVAFDQFRSARRRTKLLSRSAVDPITKSALSTCSSLVRQATYKLKSCSEQIGDLVDITSIDNIVGDLKIRLSTVVTYQLTCVDRLQNAKGNVAEEMREVLDASKELSSNAMAIVDNISEVLRSFDVPFSNGEEDDGITAAVGAPKHA